MRWPVIIFSRINSLGEVYDVFSVPSAREILTPHFDIRDPSVSSAFIIPSLAADIGILAYNTLGVQPPTYAPAALAAYFFLVAVRGLPIDECDVETPNRTYKAVRRGNDGKCEIILPKCKQICSNSPFYVQGVTVNIRTVGTDAGVVRMFECENPDRVDDSVLAAMLLSDDGENIRGAIAYSLSANGVRIKRYFIENDEKTLDFVSAHAVATLVTSFKNSEKPLRISVGKSEMHVRSLDTRLAFSSPEVRPFTFPIYIAR